MFLSASGWSILFKAKTVGNFSSVKALTTELMVSGDQCSRGSLSFKWSSVRATVCDVLPYPENWFCSVSTGFASSIFSKTEMPAAVVAYLWQHDDV